MKTAIIAIACALSCSAAASTDRQPSTEYQDQQVQSMEFERMEYDFGTISRRDRHVTADFKFRNTGDTPFMVTHTAVSCECMSVSYPQQPVMPDEEGVITVVYDPHKDKGTFVNNVKIYNSNCPRPAVLFIRGTVEK